MTTLKLIIRNIYGRKLGYPADKPTMHFVEGFGLTTLTARQIEALRGLGVKVVLLPEAL